VVLNLTSEDLARYEQVQAIARATLEAARDWIRPGVTEAGLSDMCRCRMDAHGATSYWWHGVPALVLAGKRLRDSVEGDVYRPSNVPLAADDMVTIDLSPEINGYWGDAARSFFLKNDKVVAPREAGSEQAEGMAAEASLHAHLIEVARPQMRFRELYAEIDAHMLSLGFENLDFLGNFGHEIGRDVRSRMFIDARCAARLDSVSLFTFEPHIARVGSYLAFKYEEIYRFDGGRLRVL
jgi:Xaa-Pro aminopeptidase